jgi:hypothetical protein
MMTVLMPLGSGVTIGYPPDTLGDNLGAPFTPPIPGTGDRCACCKYTSTPLPVYAFTNGQGQLAWNGVLVDDPFPVRFYIINGIWNGVRCNIRLTGFVGYTCNQIRWKCGSIDYVEGIGPAVALGPADTLDMHWCKDIT